MKTFKIGLSADEQLRLKQKGVKVSTLNEYAPDEVSALLEVSKQRADEISALIAFQSIPSVGPKFARDLISLGYFTIDDLLDKEGPALFEQLEFKQGFWTDPCVEDQFWLAVHYAHNPNTSKKWWDFTLQRKAYRSKYGYPANRPVTAWHEAISAMAG